MSNVVPFRSCPTPKHGPEVEGCTCSSSNSLVTSDEMYDWNGATDLTRVRFAISLFNHQKDNDPKFRQVSWHEFVEKMTPEQPPVVSAAAQRPAWSPATYPDEVPRGNAFVRAISMLVLDVDDGTDPAKVLDLFDGHARLVHTSWSHQREKKGATCARCRLIVPFSGPCPPSEWERIWLGVQHLAKEAGVVVDPAVDSTSEIYFRPCLRDTDQPWWFEARDGELLDWHDIKSAPGWTPKSKAIIGTSSALPFAGGSHIESRIAGMARRKCDEIRTAESRHKALLPAARYLGGLCARYQVDPEPHILALLDAAGDSNDAERSCREAFEFGRGQPCDLPPDRPLLRGGSSSDLEPQPEQVDIENVIWLPYTDLGNAKRLELRHGINLRWCDQRERWLTWDETRWAWDEHRTAHRWAQDTVERLEEEVAYWKSKLILMGDFPAPGESNQITKERTIVKAMISQSSKHSQKSQSSPRITAAPAEARALRGKTVTLDDLDTNVWTLNTLSGTLDLRDGVLHPHDRADLITRIAPVEYDPAARCPRWTAFVEQTFPDAAVRALVQRALGYSLTGDVTEQVWFVLKGEGSNGKSTLLEIVRSILGQYAIAIPGGVLEQQLHEKHETELMDFKGARFASGTEPRKGKRWDAEKVKRLTGDDRIKARAMREDFIEFDPTHKLWVSCNDAPSTDDATYGFWRRLVVVPFVVQFRRPEEPADDRPVADPTLAAVLRDELPGILNWMLDGLAEWRKGGLRVPEACVMAAAEYRKEQDEVAQFLVERCNRVQGVATASLVLFTAYRRWRESQAFTGRGLTSVQFGKALTREHISSFEGSGRRAMRGEIELKGDESPGNPATESAEDTGDNW